MSKDFSLHEKRFLTKVVDLYVNLESEPHDALSEFRTKLQLRQWIAQIELMDGDLVKTKVRITKYQDFYLGRRNWGNHSDTMPAFLLLEAIKKFSYTSEDVKLFGTFNYLNAIVDSYLAYKKSKSEVELRKLLYLIKLAKADPNLAEEKRKWKVYIDGKPIDNFHKKKLAEAFNLHKKHRPSREALLEEYIRFMNYAILLIHQNVEYFFQHTIPGDRTIFGLDNFSLDFGKIISNIPKDILTRQFRNEFKQVFVQNPMSIPTENFKTFELKDGDENFAETLQSGVVNNLLANASAKPFEIAANKYVKPAILNASKKLAVPKSVRHFHMGELVHPRFAMTISDMPHIFSSAISPLSNVLWNSTKHVLKNMPKYLMWAMGNVVTFIVGLTIEIIAGIIIDSITKETELRQAAKRINVQKMITRMEREKIAVVLIQKLNRLATELRSQLYSKTSRQIKNEYNALLKMNNSIDRMLNSMQYMPIVNVKKHYSMITQDIQKLTITASPLYYYFNLREQTIQKSPFNIDFGQKLVRQWICQRAANLKEPNFLFVGDDIQIMWRNSLLEIYKGYSIHNEPKLFLFQLTYMVNKFKVPLNIGKTMKLFESTKHVKGLKKLSEDSITYLKNKDLYHDGKVKVNKIDISSALVFGPSYINKDLKTKFVDTCKDHEENQVRLRRGFSMIDSMGYAFGTAPKKWLLPEKMMKDNDFHFILTLASSQTKKTTFLKSIYLKSTKKDFRSYIRIPLDSRKIEYTFENMVGADLTRHTHPD